MLYGQDGVPEDELETEGEACLRQLQHPPVSPGRLDHQPAAEHVSPPRLKDLLQACPFGAAIIHCDHHKCEVLSMLNQPDLPCLLSILTIDNHTLCR